MGEGLTYWSMSTLKWQKLCAGPSRVIWDILQYWTSSIYYRYMEDLRVCRLVFLPKKFATAPTLLSTGKDYASHSICNSNQFVMAA